MMFRVSNFSVIKTVSPNKHVVQHHQSGEQFMMLVRSYGNRPKESIMKLQHPNIVQFKYNWEEVGKFYYLQEYQGEVQFCKFLSAYLQRFSEPMIFQIGLQIAQAIEYLHDNQIIARILSPVNLSINLQNQIQFDPDAQQALAEYQAPEVLKGNSFDGKADVWSLGCILYEMIRKFKAFSGATDKAIAYNVIFKEPQPLGSEVSPQLQYLIRMMLQKDPNKRISIGEVIELINENLDTDQVQLEIRVSTLMRTKVEPEQEIDFKVSQIEIIEEQSMSNNDSPQIPQFLSLEEFEDNYSKLTSPVVRMKNLTLKKPLSSMQPQNRPLSSITQVQRPPTATAGIYNSGLDPQRLLFAKIKNIRPNSAVGCSGKQYIANSIMNDMQMKREKKWQSEANLKSAPPIVSQQPVKQTSKEGEASVDFKDVHKIDLAKKKLLRVNYIPRATSQSRDMSQQLQQASNNYATCQSAPSNNYLSERQNTMKMMKLWQSRITLK